MPRGDGSDPSFVRKSVIQDSSGVPQQQQQAQQQNELDSLWLRMGEGWLKTGNDTAPQSNGHSTLQNNSHINLQNSSHSVLQNSSHSIVQVASNSSLESRSVTSSPDSTSCRVQFCGRSILGGNSSSSSSRNNSNSSWKIGNSWSKRQFSSQESEHRFRMPRELAAPNNCSLHELPVPGITHSHSAIQADSQISVFPRSPLKVFRGAKQYIYDDRGQEYLDCVNGTSHVGHCHPQVVSAVSSQMSKISTAQGFQCESLDKYVKELVNTLPEPLSVCYLTNSGSEANDLAIRLARSYTGAEDVVTVEECYYGNIGILIEISTKMLKRVPGNPRRKEWSHVIPLPNTYRIRSEEGSQVAEEQEEPWQQQLKEVEAVLEAAKSQGRRIAALMSEPMFVIAGVFIPPAAYMKALYKLIRSYGGLVIVDEVQTGLGRTGEHLWGFQSYEIVPDIVTVGKPLGNGYPLGAVFCSLEISDKLGEYYSTFGGNPVSCAVGLTVLEIVRNEKLVSSTKMVGKALLTQLHSIRDSHEAVGDVRGLGLMIGLEIVKSKAEKTPDPGMATEIMYGLRTKHVLVAITGANKNVILLTPPLCFTMENGRRVVNALEEVLTELKINSVKRDKHSVIVERASVLERAGLKRSLAQVLGESPHCGIIAAGSGSILENSTAGAAEGKRRCRGESECGSDNYDDMD